MKDRAKNAFSAVKGKEIDPAAFKVKKPQGQVDIAKLVADTKAFEAGLSEPKPEPKKPEPKQPEPKKPAPAGKKK